MLWSSAELQCVCGDDGREVMWLTPLQGVGTQVQGPNLLNVQLVVGGVFLISPTCAGCATSTPHTNSEL